MNTKVGIIGCGLWGRNIVRNFYNIEALDTVCDLDPENIAFVKKEYSNVKTTDCFKNMLDNPEISGIIVATPSHTHYKLVKEALLAGKHVYVEKPIATSYLEAQELTDLADENELALMVGHLLLYHPAVNRIKSIVDEGKLGDITYVQSDRLNINFFRNDRSVMWDLAPHDLSMVSYVIGQDPVRVKDATGVSTGNDGIIDISHLDVEFENGAIAHLSDSWIHTEKRVHLMVRGTEKTLVFDDTKQEDKILIYDNFSNNKELIESADYIEVEPLKLECQHFINCIDNKIKARSDGNNGVETVRILEDAEKIMLGDDYNKIHNLKFVTSRRNKK